MAKRFNKEQSSVEIITYYVDLALPNGVTVLDATAVHTPPSGDPITPEVIVVGGQVQVQLGPLGVVIGTHQLSVRISLSNGDLPEILYDIRTEW